MKILYLVHQYLPEHVGGTELYTQTLAHGVRQQGCEVAIFTRHDSPQPGLLHRVDGDVTIYLASIGELTPTRRYLVTFGEQRLMDAFAQVLDDFQPDLVHIQHLMGLPVDLVDLLTARNIPFVVTLWDFWWVCANANLLTNYSEEVCSGPRGYLNCTRCVIARAGTTTAWLAAPAIWGSLARRNHLLRGVLSRACALLAPTQFVRNWYSEHGAPTHHLQVIPMGTKFPPAAYQPRVRTEQPVRFLYLGGIARTKGVHVIVEAFGALEQPAELWIAGNLAADPDYTAFLRQLATPQVRFIGRLSRDEVWATLAEVDVVLVPSLWYETFCFVAYEALAAGRPVIASNLGALTEAVADRVNGLLVPPGSVVKWRLAMQEFATSAALCNDLSRQIRPPLALPEHIQRIMALYATIVSSAIQ